MTVDRLAHALDLRVGARRRSDICKLLGARDATKLDDATVDVVAHIVVAIIIRLGLALESTLLCDLDFR